MKRMPTRGQLKRAPLASVLRFARWLGVRFEEGWSRRHLAGIVYLVAKKFGARRLTVPDLARVSAEANRELLRRLALREATSHSASPSRRPGRK